MTDKEREKMKKLIFLMAAILTYMPAAFAQIGNLSSDLVYTPVTPCRVLDTRSSQGGTGPIAAGGTKNFVIWGQSTYASQGGAATNCGITAGNNVAAVAMNVTVVTPAAGGFVTAYPFSALPPNAATVNFQAGDIARGNFTIAKVDQTNTLHLSIYSTSNADVVGDVVGYYSRPVATALECVSAHDNTSTVPANSAGQFITAPFCAAGYTKTMTACSNYNSLIFRRVETVPANIGHSICYYDNPASVVQNVYITSTCCRISGR